MKTKKTKTKKVKSVKSLAEIPALLKGEDIKITAEVLEKAVEDKLTEPINITDEVEPEPVEEVTNINNCEYYLEMSFNNEVYKAFTNNLKVSILSFGGKEPLTEGFVTIKKGQAEFTKKLTLIQLRQLFKDAQSLEIFLSTFYGLYGQPSAKQLM